LAFFFDLLCAPHADIIAYIYYAALFRALLLMAACCRYALRFDFDAAATLPCRLYVYFRLLMPSLSRYEYAMAHTMIRHID